MPLLHILILAIIQGITEFLPISSSGHLILVHAAFDGGATPEWNNHILLDVAVHIGTLFAVLLYFRKDIGRMITGLFDAITSQKRNSGSNLALYVLAGSIPVIIAGLGLHLIQPNWLLLIEIVAWTTLIFGIILWVTDKKCPDTRDIETLTLKDALLIGLAQTLALIPGTSRSGITMTAGRILGLKRTACAEYSLLLGIIAISGAGAISSLTLLEGNNITLGPDIALAAAIAFISGYIAIALMMRWLKHASFTPFAIYRIILGLALLIYIYWP